MAAVTTLLIEYLAKPSLDARKERILEDHQRRRAAIRGLRRAAYLSGRLTVSQRNQDLVPLRDQLLDLASRIEQLVDAAVEEISPPPALEEHWHQKMATVAATARWLKYGDPPGTVWDDFDDATDKLDSYADLFSASRWHWWLRGRIIREISSLPASGEAAAHDPKAVPDRASGLR